jgi:hypothetical protein
MGTNGASHLIRLLNHDGEELFIQNMELFLSVQIFRLEGGKWQRN